MRRLHVSHTSFLRSSRWWQVSHLSVSLHQFPQQCSVRKNYVHRNLVLNVHTSLHYNLQGTYKLNIHRVKITQNILDFVLQKHMLVLSSFKQFWTSLNQDVLNLGLSQSLFNKTTSCPSLSRVCKQLYSNGVGADILKYPVPFAAPAVNIL